MLPSSLRGKREQAGAGPDLTEKHLQSDIPTLQGPSLFSFQFFPTETKAASHDFLTVSEEVNPTCSQLLPLRPGSAV